MHFRAHTVADPQALNSDLSDFVSRGGNGMPQCGQNFALAEMLSALHLVFGQDRSMAIPDRSADSADEVHQWAIKCTNEAIASMQSTHVPKPPSGYSSQELTFRSS